MKKRILASHLVALMALCGAASADGSFQSLGSSQKPASITYYGYDYIDADGNHVCLECEAEKAAEAERERAYAERRERARQYAIKIGQIADASKTGAKPGEISVSALNVEKARDNGDAAAMKATPMRATVR
ncbi:MAG: hypothetical protein ACRECW_02385 [Phyllobacterium sp.]